MFQGDLMADPGRNMLANFTGLGQGRDMNTPELQREVTNPRAARKLRIAGVGGFLRYVLAMIAEAGTAGMRRAYANSA